MVFSSILFLFRFMPIAFLLYYASPKKYKNLVLLIVSLVFYSWGEVKYFPIMVASILIDYTASRIIQHNRHNLLICRLSLAASVVFNLGMLGFFKYTNFLIANTNALLGTDLGMMSITLPLGISFYTFQTMSYTIDVYLGKVEAEDNIIDFGAFVVLFPQLIAGPIVRYTDINRELRERTVDFDQITEGIQTFIMGIGSKVLIANSIGAMWTEIESIGFEGLSMPLAWLAILAFTFQIYFDFSGYSLMAIGLGKMLGFNFPQNFDFPYISRSMTEFWRRWHMTLGSWFREYLYFPLGGSRKGYWRTIFNLFVVWAATGLWHGASWNFVFWGLYFFVLLVIEKSFLLKYLNRNPLLSAAYMLTLIPISWAIFAITDLGSLSVFFGRLFSFARSDDWQYYLRNYGITFLAAAVFSTPYLKPLYKKICRNQLASILFFGIVLVVSVAYLVDATYNPFLYFRF